MGDAQNQNQPTGRPGAPDLQALINSTGAGGQIKVGLDRLWIYNPVTGVYTPRQRTRLTRWDESHRNVIDVDDQQVLTCWAGDVISDSETVAACAVCGRLCCSRHSVLDPFCGSLLCLNCSRLFPYGSTLVRICERCHTALSRGWLRRAFDLLLGAR